MGLLSPLLQGAPANGLLAPPGQQPQAPPNIPPAIFEEWRKFLMRNPTATHEDAIRWLHAQPEDERFSVRPLPFPQEYRYQNPDRSPIGGGSEYRWPGVDMGQN